MAAGAGAAYGGSLESTLARKFQSVTNTMDSIQSLSTWCIDNKKYHSLIVRQWIKCLRKSDASQRLNLFYLANDVIQNCKRKNAIVYRTEFAEVLPEAFLLVNHEGDTKVIKSVERILSIWEDRGVYTGTLITELRNSLVREESPPETPVEQKTPVESKADIQSKIVAEFVPQALIDKLSRYKRSLEEVDLREKQLAAMRVDICNSDALRKLKDKAGGKKFSKDFEEGSAQLQDFVKYYEKQNKLGPPLLEALGNADIFYEMQYKEVKIVANAYQTFANRVSHLKRKLDTLKATLPDLDESPIPSPSADAPSPTGSESPFHDMEMANSDPELDGSVMDDEAEPPAPSPLSSVGGSPTHSETVGQNDNRDVEDMDLSEEETGGGNIIVEQVERPTLPEVSKPVSKSKEPPVATEQPVKKVTPPVAAPATAVESVDLGKIGSILSSLSSVIKNTGPPVESPPVAAPAAKNATPATPVAAQDATSLVNLLSKVDVSPSELLGALSKVQGQSSLEGITSFLSSPAAGVSLVSSATGKIPPSSTPASAETSQSLPLSSVPPSRIPTVEQRTNSKGSRQTSRRASALVQAIHRDMDLTTDPEPSSSSQSLESKIHSFLQGNSAFNAFDLGFSTNPVGGGNLSPVTGTDNQEGTPVRDEGGGTPTQDEIMDKAVVTPFASNANQLSTGEAVDTAATIYQNSTQNTPGSSKQQDQLQTGLAQNGTVYQPLTCGKPEMSDHGITAPVANYQQFSAQTGGLVPGKRAPGSATGTQAAEGFQRVSDMGWYNDSYPEGSSQQPHGYNTTVLRASGENKTLGVYPYQSEQTLEPQTVASQQSATTSPGFFISNLPPVPKLPPPPQTFDAPPSVVSSTIIPEQQVINCPGEVTGARVESAISGMVVHDHQHKSMFNTDDQPRSEDVHPRRDDSRYQEDLERYRDDRHDSMGFQDNAYRHPDDPYYRPGSPPHQYHRGRGLAPSPSEDLYYHHEYQRHSPPPLQYTPRRPPPPHYELRHPGLRPPPRPPYPGLHPHPRGPPGPPFPPFHGPNPRLRIKRPGPRLAGPVFPPKRPFPPPRY